MTEENLVHKPVDTIIAGAGTGKTHRLVEEIVSRVMAGTEPHRILATTFTKKAAAELSGRVRMQLIKCNRPDLAAAMLSARIGTVNSVCGSLVSEFAFELRRSPETEVIAEDRQPVIFGRAVGPVIEECGNAISEIAERFDIRPHSSFVHGHTIPGWHDDVRRIVDLARANGIRADRLYDCTTHSVDGLLALFPTTSADQTADGIDAVLQSALSICIQTVDQTRDGLKAGTLKSDVPIIESAWRAAQQSEPISWSNWVRLGKLGVTQTDAGLFADVVAAAKALPGHPRLHTDLRLYIERIFDCAAKCMTAYAIYKHARGLLDFVDQEMLALEVISAPSNFGRLRELIGAVYVDEFQDSSPIQIALFSALSKIADHNLWVGDPKQSIYGFRDADPALSSAAAAAICAASNGTVGYLRKSYRTRPQLANFVNMAISSNFERMGMSIDEIQFNECERAENPDMPAALSIWELAGKNKSLRTADLAGRIAGLLNDAAAWPVAIKDGQPRDARGGDIAILCRGNAQVNELAVALSERGVSVAVERSGLLDQPETELVLAMLNWIADSSNMLALAEIARFVSKSEEWFSSLFEESSRDSLLALIPFSYALSLIRDRAAQLTPVEIFDAVLQIEAVTDVVLGWDHAEDRLHNLEAFRDMIEAYLDEQHVEHQATTLAGLCAWIATQEKARLPQSDHPDAVNILTYHGAKGLEWPIVLLTELDAQPKSRPFGVTAEDLAAPRWDTPLTSRILRFWPWPYGQQQKDGYLDGKIPVSPQGQVASEAELRERTRLLYVGLTRARDHLGLVTAGPRQNWLDELQDDQGTPLISLEEEALRVGGEMFAKRSCPDVAKGDDIGGPEKIEKVYRCPQHETVAYPPLRIRPSDTSWATEGVKITAIETIGERISLSGEPDFQLLGEAIHSFLAADDLAEKPEDRVALARGILERWNTPQLSSEELVAISDRLDTFLRNKFGAVPNFGEWPVHAEIGPQVIVGRIDQLLELDDGYVILDHKSFPGTLSEEEDRLHDIASQLALYARALGQVTDKSKFEFWIHQPIVGQMTQIDISWST